MKPRPSTVREQRTARLTVLIDPRKKAVFEELCAAEDVTPSQVVRGLIRRYLEERLGAPWAPADATPSDDPPTAELADVPREKRAPARRRA